ncbi:MAG: (Fe-S)-binding protein, partial [Bacteroidales bacterium]|nr:(Fe-S)-binding protein [Bacteroidales bacterium]
MSRFDPFVLPFAIGLYTVLIIFIAKGFDWIKHLPADDRRKLGRGIISLKIFPVLGEIFSESLLHRRIFRKNPLLGYMHMSLAFGWFLLVVIGTIESKIFSRDIVNNPWDPIFLKFFEHHTAQHRYHGIFGFTMDFLLAFVLTGVMLAWIKRISSRLFGIRKPTRQIFFDKIALGTLWVIFPLRLIAESLTAAEYQNGGFLTNNLGGFIDRFLPAAEMEYTFWWLYSFSVGVFFVTLPYSRYMHIPTETILI